MAALLAAAVALIAGTVLGVVAARYRLRALTGQLHAALTATCDPHLAQVVAHYRRRLTRWGAR